MSRGWFLLLAVMVGLNAALLYDRFAGRRPEPDRLTPRPGVEASGPPGAERGPRFGEAFIERRVEHLTRMLDLSPSQREGIFAIERATMGEIEELRERARAMRLDIRELLHATPVDSARIRSLSKELHTLQGKIESIVTENLIREAVLLTPDQRERFLERRPWGGRPGEPHRPGRRSR